MAAFLILETLVIGVFTVAGPVPVLHLLRRHGLVPMFLIIGIWGGPRTAIYAAYKFFLYTLLGSVLMLLAMLWMAHYEAGTTEYSGTEAVQPSASRSPLPDPGRGWPSSPRSRSRCRCGPSTPGCLTPTFEAPTAGSVILAGHIAEAGRVRLHPASTLPMFPLRRPRLFQPAGLHPVGRSPSSIRRWSRWRQDGHEEADRLFVDRPHGFCDAGHLLRQRPAGMQGAVFQMISHGF